MIRKPGMLVLHAIERASFKNNIWELYQKKNILKEIARRRASQIRDSKGVITQDEEARLQTWAGYL